VNSRRAKILDISSRRRYQLGNTSEVLSSQSEVRKKPELLGRKLKEMGKKMNVHLSDVKVDEEIQGLRRGKPVAFYMHKRRDLFHRSVDLSNRDSVLRLKLFSSDKVQSPSIEANDRKKYAELASKFPLKTPRKIIDVVEKENPHEFLNFTKLASSATPVQREILLDQFKKLTKEVSQERKTAQIRSMGMSSTFQDSANRKMFGVTNLSLRDDTSSPSSRYAMSSRDSSRKKSQSVRFADEDDEKSTRSEQISFPSLKKLTSASAGTSPRQSQGELETIKERTSALGGEGDDRDKAESSPIMIHDESILDNSEISYDPGITNESPKSSRYEGSHKRNASWSTSSKKTHNNKSKQSINHRHSLSNRFNRISDLDTPSCFAPIVGARGNRSRKISMGGRKTPSHSRFSKQRTHGPLDDLPQTFQITNPKLLVSNSSPDDPTRFHFQQEVSSNSLIRSPKNKNVQNIIDKCKTVQISTTVNEKRLVALRELEEKQAKQLDVMVDTLKEFAFAEANSLDLLYRYRIESIREHQREASRVSQEYKRGIMDPHRNLEMKKNKKQLRLDRNAANADLVKMNLF